MRVSGADFATETVWDMLGVPSPGSDEVPPPSPLAPQHLPTTRVKSRHLCVCVRKRDREGLSTLFLPLLLSQTCLPLWEQFRGLSDFSGRQGQALENAGGSCHGVGVPGPWPQAPSAPAPTPPSRLAPELPAAPRISPGKRGCGGSLAACPHPSGPQSAHREREERGHRGGLPWSELPQGKQQMGQGCFCRRAGQLCKLSEGPPGLYTGGRGAAASPGPSPELAGQLEANRKVERKHRPRGAARARTHTH